MEIILSESFVFFIYCFNAWLIGRVSLIIKLWVWFTFGVTAVFQLLYEHLLSAFSLYVNMNLLSGARDSAVVLGKADFLAYMLYLFFFQLARFPWLVFPIRFAWFIFPFVVRVFYCGLNLCWRFMNCNHSYLRFAGRDRTVVRFGDSRLLLVEYVDTLSFIFMSVVVVG